MKRVVGILSIVLLAACGDDENTTEEKLIDQWKGATPHFEATGTLNGTPFTIAMSAEDAENIDFLNIQRKWCLPAVMEDDGVTPIDPATFTEWYMYGMDLNVRDREVNTYVGDVFGAEYDKFQIAFRGKDVHVNGLSPEELEVVPGTTAVPEAGQARIEIAIVDKNGTTALGTLWQQYAESGSATFGAFTGAPTEGETPPLDQEPTGGVISVRFSQTDEVTISFSARADDNAFKLYSDTANCVYPL